MQEFKFQLLPKMEGLEFLMFLNVFWTEAGSM